MWKSINVDILKAHAYQGIPLNYEEAYKLGCFFVEVSGKDLSGLPGSALKNYVRDLVQVFSVMCALHNVNLYKYSRTDYDQERHGHRLSINAAEQIAGICAAVFQKDIAKSPNGFLKPKVPLAVGCCGMGGDLILTPNVSTLASLIAAAAGIFMAKHGSPGNTVRTGSSDMIQDNCGINAMSSKDEAEKCLEKHHFCYIEALDTHYKRIHLQTHLVAALAHMNDIIGPITNPVDPQLVTMSLIGVNHLIPPAIVAESYQIMNAKGVTNLKHGLFVRGFVDEHRYEGMDEVSICPGGTRVAELKDGEIREYDLYAEDFGLEPVSAESIAPKGNKGEFSLGILKGEIDGPPLQMVLANAAMLFYLAGKSQNLKECYRMAEETHRSGKPYQTMLAVREMIPRKSE